LGQTPIIIIEKLYEINIVIEASKKLEIKPVVGVRAKLTTQGIVRTPPHHTTRTPPLAVPLLPLPFVLKPCWCFRSYNVQGRWGGSTGDHAKFGLSAAEIMEVVKRLREHDMLSSLQLLHFHIGSQISRISVVKDALREAGQFFVELHRLGCDMKYLDIGGGLGIDYDGSKTSFHASMNYTIGMDRAGV
jgi:arginine decarboxylase